MLIVSNNLKNNYATKVFQAYILKKPIFVLNLDLTTK